MLGDITRTKPVNQQLCITQCLYCSFVTSCICVILYMTHT